MTDLEPTTPAEVVLPHTGELVDLGNPTAVAEAIDSIREYKHRLDSLRAGLEEVLQLEAARQGTKTLHLDGLDAIITGGEKVDYDHVELDRLLHAAGLPENRIRDAIVETVTYKVNATEIKRIAGANPAYAQAVEACRHVEPAPWRVTIRRP